MVTRLSPAESRLVTEAVAAAESRTDGEVVAVVAARSDKYNDAAANWALVAVLGWLALLSAVPGIAETMAALVDPWGEPGPHLLFTAALVGAAVVFLIVRLMLRSEDLRLRLVPPAAKGRRVHARALSVFKVAVNGRTRAQTGVLVYLSLAEHRAEIVAESGIHARVSPECWGEAMAALIAGAKEGRIAEGMAAAVTEVGLVLAEHFPRSEDDSNELCDRLIEL